MINIANYFLIGYAFFLPLSPKIASNMLIPTILCLLLSGQTKDRFLYIIKDRIIQSIILMYSVYVLWTLGSNHIDTAFYELNKLFKLFSIMILIAITIKKEFTFKIIQGFLLAMFFSEIVSYAMYFQIVTPFLQMMVGPRYDNVPFLMNYTQYSTIMSIVMGFLFYQMLTNTTLSIAMKSIYFLFLITASFNLFILGSRIGYILFFTSILIVLFLVYKKNIKRIVVSAIVFILLGYSLAYMGSPLFRDRVALGVNDIMQLTDNNLSTSLGVRVGFFLYSFEIIKDNFIFGVGTGDHVYEVRTAILEKESSPINVENMLVNIPNSHGSNLHNQFIDTTLQFGIIGLIVLLNIFYQILKYKPYYSFLNPLQYLLVINIIIASFANPLFLYGDVERIFVLLSALLIRPFSEILIPREQKGNKTYVI